MGKIADEDGNIVSPLPKRRHRNGKDQEAVIEVVAEFTGGDHLGEVSVGRCNQADIHRNGSRAAQPFEFLFLKSSEQFGLELQRDVADFIQEQGSLMGQLKTADLLRDCSGKSALFVAEEFAFKQSGGNCGTVQFDKSAVATSA